MFNGSLLCAALIWPLVWPLICRFPKEYQDQLYTFAELFIPHIIGSYQELPGETKSANQNLAYFLTRCLSLMNRGFVFKIVKLYLDTMHAAKDSITLHHFKVTRCLSRERIALIIRPLFFFPRFVQFEFLALITAYEHHVPINLPLELPSNGSLSRQFSLPNDMNEAGENGASPTLTIDDPTVLSEEFCRLHFTVGALLMEVKSALSEVHQVRSMALSVLRNLLVKHSFDDRYQSRAQQARIASLYLPFISIIFDNVGRIQVAGFTPGANASPAAAAAAATAANNSQNVPIHANKRVSFIDVGSLPSCSPSSTLDRNDRIEMISKPTVRRNSSLESRELSLKRDSSYLQMIAGTMPVSAAINLNGQHDHIEHIQHLQVHSNSDPDISSKSPSPDIEQINQQNLNSESQRSTSPLTNQQQAQPPSHHRSHSLPVRFDKLNNHEVRDLLIIFAWVVKHVPEEFFATWFRRASDQQIQQFLSLNELCVYEFRYSGGRNGRDTKNKSADKAMTLPARITINDSITQEKATAENVFSGLLEANLATEVGLIALDVIGVITSALKERLMENNGDNLLMRKIFSSELLMSELCKLTRLSAVYLVYIAFLQLGQSETLLKHLFAALRSYINNFPTVLFAGNPPTFVGKLCFELLRCCSSRLTTVRNEAAALLYLLMRANFEYTNHVSMTRVHLQVIISVSRLLGDAQLLLNNSRFQESLALINNYSSCDKTMQNSKFPNEVRELTKKVKTVLMATAAMREHENDSEMMLDLQHHLANSYAETSPALRRTWLESMAKNHVKEGNYSEAAHCLAHIAALEAEILRRRQGSDPDSSPGNADASCNIHQRDLI